MKNFKLRILCYAVAVCNLLLAAVFYLRLPDRIPMHWAMDGTVTYHPRHELFFMCGMGLLFALLFDLLPRIDPRRGNYQRFGTYYDGFPPSGRKMLLRRRAGDGSLHPAACSPDSL